MAGKAFRDLLTEPQLQIIPVRTDQTHPTFQLGLTTTAQGIQQRGLEQLRIGVPAAASLSTTSTLLRYRIDAGRDVGASSW